MIRSALNPNPVSPGATPRPLPALRASRVARDANTVAIKRVDAHSASSQHRCVRRGTVLTARTHLSNPSPMRQHHSIELALEEADGDYHAEQQLRRANVSPFFTSNKAPEVAAIAMSELELDPTRLSSRRMACDGHSACGRNLQAIVIPPLSLDFDDSYSDSRSLSRSSSWQDFELLPGNITAEHSRGRSQNTQDVFLPDVENKGSLSAATDAWDLFLSEHSRSNVERVSYTQALKTPTAAEHVTSFAGPFPYLACKDDLKAFSPTPIDKKVLVTENDLKLPTYSLDCFGEPVVRSLDMSDAFDQETQDHVAAPQHKRKATLPPPSSSSSSPSYSRSKREKLFPREALVETLDRPTKQPKLQPLAYRYAPGSPVHAVKISSSRRGRTRDDEPEQYVLNVHRLPDLMSDHRPRSSTRDPYAFPAMDTNWKRTLALEHVGKMHSQRAAREQRAPSPATPHQLDSHHELLYLPGIFPGANFTRSPRFPRPLKPTKRKIGIYGPEARRERLRRFHEKRKQRVFHKRIKYDCRKRLANACPRIKGRFVRKHEFDEATQSSPRAEGGEGADVQAHATMEPVENGECVFAAIL